MVKICRNCKAELDESEFRISRTNKAGEKIREPYCKSCAKKIDRINRQEKNKEFEQFKKLSEQINTTSELDNNSSEQIKNKSENNPNLSEQLPHSPTPPNISEYEANELIRLVPYIDKLIGIVRTGSEKVTTASEKVENDSDIVVKILGMGKKNRSKKSYNLDNKALEYIRINAKKYGVNESDMINYMLLEYIKKEA